MELPDTRYVWNGDVALAYQVNGSGPHDLVYFPQFASNVELNWDSPRYARMLEGLASFSRLITYDRRGWGLSDRLSPGDLPPLESHVDDVRTVMDAARSRTAALFAWGAGGTIASLLAAMHPDRVTALVLFHGWATMKRTDDTPWNWGEDEAAEHAEHRLRAWGTRELAEEMIRDDAPSVLGDERELLWLIRYTRFAAGPGMMLAEWKNLELQDIRDVLPTIHVPTLVIQRTGGVVDIEDGRYIAARIPDAELVELPGDDDPPWCGDTDALLDQVEAFVTGEKHVRDRQRVLATVLFTDIVDSTRRAAALGDRAWREVLEGHHEAVRRELIRFSGNEVDTQGDGFFASFDGPARAINCARAIVDAVRPLGFEVRIGCHTGEVEIIDGKVGGLAVIIGSRIGALAQRSEVLVSSTVKDLVAGSGLVFDDAGEHDLKGIPDRWHLYRVVDGREPAQQGLS
jgi:class 3 adenylate cyclase/pimeloyl-ACP methyl ester carboxylesterase